jgi:hypothetical protein
LKKKNRAAGRQKNFQSCGRGHLSGQCPQDRKFFGSFFQKRTSLLYSNLRFAEGVDGPVKPGHDVFICRRFTRTQRFLL